MRATTMKQREITMRAVTKPARALWLLSFAAAAACGPVDEIEGARGAAAAIEPIELSDSAIAQHILAGMASANASSDFTAGIHFALSFHEEYPEMKDEYWKGHANEKYWVLLDGLKWGIRAHTGASKAIKNWLAGPTIADCLSVVRVLQTDAIRAAIGDHRFDVWFGEESAEDDFDKLFPRWNGLVIGVPNSSQPYPTVDSFLKATDAATKNQPGTVGNRPVSPGEHYYFSNHPLYARKHPGGAFQGENALFAGYSGKRQIWTGLGASNVTEDQLYDMMVGAYNAPRTDRDLEVLKNRYGDAKNWPLEYLERTGAFTDHITVQDILNAPEATVDGEKRKGGFVVSSGKKIDVEKVKRDLIDAASW
jgi:hypothetical protein